MKILFLSDDFPPQSFGGAGISTYELALGMRKAGHQVFVITTCRKESEAGEEDYKGLKIYKIASDYSSKWRWYLGIYNRSVVHKVEKILREIRPDVVHVNNVHFYLSYYCIKLAKRYSRVVVFTARDVMTFNFSKLNTKRYLEDFNCRTNWFDHLKQAKKRWNPFRNFLVKHYLNYADKIFAVSQALKEALRQNGINNVDIMHTGIDVNSWSVSEEEQTLFRRKYNLDNKKVLLFGGRLSGAKGGTKVLEAMVKIVQEVPDAVLFIVASFDHRAEQIRERADGLGLKGKLVFTGWINREKIKYIYACADLVLVPSICFDSLPRIVLEAMAVGKPVVGTCYGGASEAIVDGVTGYVVNPFDVKIMSEKILDLLNNPLKAKNFGKIGKERIMADFNLSKQINLVTSLPQQLFEQI